MAIILAINSGSSSFKYQLINMPDEKVLAKGIMERIGMDESISTLHIGEKKIEKRLHLQNHEKAVARLLDMLLHPKYGAIKDINQIKGIGHRIVHGDEKFTDSVIITEEVTQQLEEFLDLAPLHNTANIIGVRAFKKIIPAVPAVAVFDTAFHQTMPKESFLYSLPYEFYEKFAVRKYGFHGTSHKYVTQRAAEILNRPLEELRLISCHLGNGASITAVKGGRSINTSMGFTPLSGLTMGTRSGDIDPAIIPYIMGKTGSTLEEMMEILNKASGLLGISGLSSDMRDIQQAAKNGNDRAQLAIDIFVQRIHNYIGAYAVQMNGVDAIIFTAGIGENSQLIRSLVLENLRWMRVEFDPMKNRLLGKETELTVSGSPVKAFVIPTNEEIIIARDTVSVANITEEALV